MKALIIGATGATGKDLLDVLLNDPDYTQVITFVRRAGGKADPKLQEVITDFDKLEAVAGYISGDVLFSCLGTTLKAAGSKDKQWHIDYEIPLKFAGMARKNGVPGTVLLSAYGASSRSRVFYSKMKGELEESIERLGFDQYIVFRPGMLLRKDTDRLGEKIATPVINFLNSLGLIRKFRPLPTEVLAGKMARAPKFFGKGKHIVELDKIFGF